MNHGKYAIRFVMATAAFVWLTVGSVTAATLSYTYGQTSKSTDWTTTDSTAVNFNVQQFDSSLGELTSVTLTLSASMLSELTVTNTGDSSSSGNARTELVLTISSPITPGLSPLDFLTGKFDYTNLAANGGTIDSGVLTGSSPDESVTYTSSINLDAFTGSSNILYQLITYTSTVLSNNGGNTNASQTTTAAAGLTATYTYNAAVPEPSAMLMLIGGCALLVASMRGNLHRFRR